MPAPLSSCLCLAVLATAAVAQRAPLPGIPMTPPPVNHPALGNQPLFQPPKSADDGAGAGGGAAKPAVKPAPAPAPADPDSDGVKLTGKDLASAIAKVTALPWQKSLAAAQAQAAASGKPILWLQGLGALDGDACSALQSLRGLTLCNDLVLAELRDQFVLGYGDLERAPHVGLSGGYRRDQSVLGATNGAGGRNVQLFCLAADGTVVHALPGFWHAIDLLPELQLARQLHDLWLGADHTLAQKVAMAQTLHRGYVKKLGAGTMLRSRWRAEDLSAEQARGPARDTIARDEKGQPVKGAGGFVLVPTVQVVHERLAAKPFVKFGDFDVEAFVDYGVPLHDPNAAVEKGRTFSGAVANQQRRERGKK